MSTAEHLHVVDRCLDPLSRDIQQIKAVDRSVRLVSSQARTPTVGGKDAPSFDSLKPDACGEHPPVVLGNPGYLTDAAGKPLDAKAMKASIRRECVDACATVCVHTDEFDRESVMDMLKALMEACVRNFCGTCEAKLDRFGVDYGCGTTCAACSRREARDERRTQLDHPNNGG